MIAISVVIPAYNEARRIGRTILTINKYLRGKYDYEIIIVDDGSTDGTAEIVRSLPVRVRLLRNAKNQGKGYSVRRGVLAAEKEWILFSDADLSTPIAEVKKLLRHKSYDVIIGSRALKGSKIIKHQPVYREYAGKTFNLFVQLICIGKIKDTQCGFKLFRRSVAQDLFRQQRIDRFAFDVEVLFIARKEGYTIKEVPVVWRNDERTRVHFFRDSTAMLRDIIRIRMSSLLGKYKRVSTHTRRSPATP